MSGKRLLWRKNDVGGVEEAIPGAQVWNRGALITGAAEMFGRRVEQEVESLVNEWVTHWRNDNPM